MHLVELEDLLQKSTNNNPDERPTIQQFKSALENYLSILDDDDLSQKSDWEFLNKYLFPFGQESAVWRNLDKIIEILNIVGTSPAYNHMLLSTKGGLDFKKAEKANEEGCIYVYDTLGICYLCKPKCLIYESFAEICVFMSLLHTPVVFLHLYPGSIKELICNDPWIKIAALSYFGMCRIHGSAADVCYIFQYCPHYACSTGNAAGADLAGLQQFPADY